MKKFLALLLAGLFLTAFLVGCAPSDEDILVMATNAEFPPYEYKEGEEFKGIDVELAEAIAAKLGKKLVIEDVPFGSIVSGVNTGKYDIGMAGLTVTDERKLEVNFSKSYATGVQVVIVKENSAIKSLDDLAGANVMIGVQQDTTGHIYASDTPEKGGYGEDHVIPYTNGAAAVAALVADKVQAVIIDNEPAKAYVAANEGLTILEAKWLTEDYAIAINKADTQLLADIDAALDALIADGTVQRIIDKYINAD